MVPSVLVVLLLSIAWGIVLAWPSYDQLPNPEWSDLRVKFSPLGFLDGFYKMPRTACDARAKGYVNPPEEPRTDIEILCPENDPIICIIYDLRGNVAGIQIGFQKKDVEKTGYPYEKHRSFVSKHRFGYDMYITTLFFVEQYVLWSGGRDSNETGTGLWLQDGPDRTVMFEIPRYEKDVIKTAYTQQACVYGMGRHYYYNISQELDCNDFHPIFGLYKNGKMVGFGFQTFGKRTPIVRDWFEFLTLPDIIVRIAIPNERPSCLIERIKAHGMISLHVYFVEEPWKIVCGLDE